MSTYTKQHVKIIAPTAPDLLSAVSQNLIRNLLSRASGHVQLPSLRERAQLVASQKQFLVFTDWT